MGAIKEIVKNLRSGIKDGPAFKWLHRAFKAATLIYANIVMWKGDNEAAILWFVVFLVLYKFDPKE